MTTLDKIGTLVAWLRKRGEPDSGINYSSQSYSLENGSRQARVELFGSDADFIAKHFHGQGARDLADALSSIPAQGVGVDRAIEELCMLGENAFRDDPKRSFGAIAEAVYLLRNLAPSHPAAVAVTDEMVRAAVENAVDTFVALEERMHDAAVHKLLSVDAYGPHQKAAVSDAVDQLNAAIADRVRPAISTQD